jgi:hypothetical protein
MTRPLRDYLGEAIRRMRYGLVRPLWADARDDVKDNWRQDADAMIRVLRDEGLSIELKPSPCQARQAGDSMVCDLCNMGWDVGDSFRPACLPIKGASA